MTLSMDDDEDDDGDEDDDNDDDDNDDDVDDEDGDEEDDEDDGDDDEDDCAMKLRMMIFTMFLFLKWKVMIDKNDGIDESNDAIVGSFPMPSFRRA